jgi:hypothetical protein
LRSADGLECVFRVQKLVLSFACIVMQVRSLLMDA